MSKNSPLLSFKPAAYSAGKECFVYYYALDPATNELKRKRIKLNHIKGTANRKKYANELINEINSRLYSGWSPFLEETAPRGFISFTEALDKFIAVKRKELRPNSMRSYTSFTETIKKWLTETNNKELFCVKFGKYHATGFMNWVYSTLNVSNKTYNNYKIFMTALFNWLIENQYCSTNWFTDISKKKEAKKDRTVISKEDRSRIKEHLEKTDPEFLIVCMLVYHSLIRPGEITRLKPKDFDLKNQTIIVRAENAKNGQDRITTIPDSMMPMLVSWNYNYAQNEQYIFGEGGKPGKVPLSSRVLSKRWEQLRKALNLSIENKLYSFRDTGIIEMIKDGVNLEDIRRQAGHSSLEITTRYTNHAAPEGSEQIKRRAKEF